MYDDRSAHQVAPRRLGEDDDPNLVQRMHRSIPARILFRRLVAGLNRVLEGKTQEPEDNEMVGLLASLNEPEESCGRFQMEASGLCSRID